MPSGLFCIQTGDCTEAKISRLVTHYWGHPGTCSAGHGEECGNQTPLYSKLFCSSKSKHTSRQFFLKWAVFLCNPDFSANDWSGCGKCCTLDWCSQLGYVGFDGKQTTARANSNRPNENAKHFVIPMPDTRKIGPSPRQSSARAWIPDFPVFKCLDHMHLDLRSGTFGTSDAKMFCLLPSTQYTMRGENEYPTTKDTKPKESWFRKCPAL